MKARVSVYLAIIALLGSFLFWKGAYDMSYQNIVISSGHGLHIPGARDLIDEVTEARRVTDRVAEIKI